MSALDDVKAAQAELHASSYWKPGSRGFATTHLYRCDVALQSALADLAAPGPLPPSGAYWVGDFRLGGQDYSAFDTHDAQLASTTNDPVFGATKGSVVVSKPPPWYLASRYSNRHVVSNSFPSSSVSGAGSMLWMPGEYFNAWTQKGARTWFRLGVLFPDGTDPAYPGRTTPIVGDGVQSSWHIFMEWHQYDGYFGAHGGGGGGGSTCLEIYDQAFGTALMLRPIGGQPNALTAYYILETDATQTKANTVAGGGSPSGTVQPLKFNHWYDILVYQEFDASPTVGYMEWWVDGNLRFADHLPTLFAAADGSQPGLGYQSGMYRGTSGGTGTQIANNETVYTAAMIAGPTRASVGG